MPVPGPMLKNAYQQLLHHWSKLRVAHQRPLLVLSPQREQTVAQLLPCVLPCTRSLQAPMVPNRRVTSISLCLVTENVTIMVVTANVQLLPWEQPSQQKIKKYAVRRLASRVSSFLEPQPPRPTHVMTEITRCTQLQIVQQARAVHLTRQLAARRSARVESFSSVKTQVPQPWMLPVQKKKLTRSQQLLFALVQLVRLRILNAACRSARMALN